MITIGLDEFGHFENENSQMSFVGGYIYRGNDYEREKARLATFLEDACKSFNIRYPYDMHLNKEASNAAAVRYFEANIEKPLMEYLKSNGKYHFTCMVKGREGREDFKNISNLVDDSKANNLYEHMMWGLLDNILFNTLEFEKEQKVRLEIPNRVSVIDDRDEERIKQFETLGYIGRPLVKRGRPHHMFYSTDQKTFKAALSVKIMDSRKKYDMRFESINIQSIDYDSQNESMPFLYLADIVCNCFKTRFNTNRMDFGIEVIHNWCGGYTGNRPFLWAYDHIDGRYNSIVEKYFNKDFIGVQMDIYEARKLKSHFGKYYDLYWFNNIEANLEGCFDRDRINIYIAEMDSFYTKRYINYEEGADIVDRLWSMIEKEGRYFSDQVRYKAADIGIRAYNHKGSIMESNPYYNVCESLKDRVPIEDYLVTLNRSVQVHTNEFDFHSAIEKEKYIVECLDILKKARQDIAELYDANTDVAVRSTARARALSSLGQFYAFTGNGDALECFIKAIEEFGEDSDNIKITLSHLLNFASGSGDRLLFQKYAPAYFNSIADLKGWYEEAVSGKDPFMLYTYMKAVNNLYINTMDADLLNSIHTANYEALGFNTASHPWELIYKNIGIMLYKRGLNKNAAAFMEKGAECVKSVDVTIIAINHFTLIQDSYYKNDEEGFFRRLQEFKDWLSQHPSVEKYFKDALEGGFHQVFEKLKGKYTFTYA